MGGLYCQHDDGADEGRKNVIIDGDIYMNDREKIATSRYWVIFELVELKRRGSKELERFTRETAQDEDLPVRTVKRWLKKYEESGLEGLAPKMAAAARPEKRAQAK